MPATLIHVDTNERFDFPYFPLSVKRDAGWSWGRAPAPGRARPFIGGGAGNEWTVSFQAQIEGERARHERRMAGQSMPMDISPDLHLMLSWVLPDDADLTGGYGFPNELFLQLGTLVNDRVVLETLSINTQQWGRENGSDIVIAATVDFNFLVTTGHETAPQYRGRNPSTPYTWRTTAL